MIKRAMVFVAAGLAAGCLSTAASAHVGVGVYLGGPVYAAPAVVYAPPPPVVYAPPPPVYYGGYGYGGYRHGYWGGGPRWHDHGRHRGWEGRHHGGRW